MTSEVASAVGINNTMFKSHKLGPDWSMEDVFFSLLKISFSLPFDRM
jgi:hypothetical protein